LITSSFLGANILLSTKQMAKPILLESRCNDNSAWIE